MSKINLSFSNLFSADFLQQAQRIVTALTGNPAFQPPWPTPIPTLAQLGTDLAAYQAALAAAAAGDRNHIADRRAARRTLQNDLALIAPYLQAVSRGDAVMLGSTGFPLRKQSVRATVFDPPSAPANFVVTRGSLSGTLSVSCRRMSGVGSYEVQQVATADPTVEANWSAAGTFKNSQRMTLEGLPSGKLCSVRLRAVGTAGPGAWTLPASLMVV
jgi:hypothetical protein